MKSVTITKDDSGNFSVTDNGAGDPDGDNDAMPGQGEQPPSGDSGTAQSFQQQPAQSTGTPAPDLKSALMMAGRFLMQEDKNAAPSPFDEGVKSVLPQRA